MFIEQQKGINSTCLESLPCWMENANIPKHLGIRACLKETVPIDLNVNKFIAGLLGGRFSGFFFLRSCFYQGEEHGMNNCLFSSHTWLLLMCLNDLFLKHELLLGKCPHSSAVAHARRQALDRGNTIDAPTETCKKWQCTPCLPRSLRKSKSTINGNQSKEHHWIATSCH